MKIIILTPMEIEKEKVHNALSRITNLKHNYEVVVSGIGRESVAKAFMYLKKPQDFIIRIISDYLPHEKEIDFFEEVKAIDFFEAMQLVDSHL